MASLFDYNLLNIQFNIVYFGAKLYYTLWYSKEKSLFLYGKKGVTKCKANTVLNEMYLCGLATVDKYYMPPHSTREKIKSCQQIRLPFKSDDIICSEKSLGGPKFGGKFAVAAYFGG